jgi:hypothetical protein
VLIDAAAELPAIVGKYDANRHLERLVEGQDAVIERSASAAVNGIFEV